MIKHHPSEQFLLQFSQGALPASLSIAVSAHIELCECCRGKVEMYEASQAAEAFVDATEEQSSSNEFSDMFDFITSDEEVEQLKVYQPTQLEYQDKVAVLPRAIGNTQRSAFVHVGKLARARMQVDDGDVRASLLQIDKGGEIPEHTHTGFELTLLLDGEFSDEDGSYVPGDFIWRDARHNHSPKTADGCLCFTVVNSALHFNKGLSKLLNPIGNLIY